MKLKAGRYRVDVESPFIAWNDSLSERITRVYDWIRRKGGTAEQHSPMPPDSVRIVFTIPKDATWGFDFATPTRQKDPPSKPFPWAEAKKRGPRDIVDEAVDVTKKVAEQAPQIGALLLIALLLASRGK